MALILRKLVKDTLKKSLLSEFSAIDIFLFALCYGLKFIYKLEVARQSMRHVRKRCFATQCIGQSEKWTRWMVHEHTNVIQVRGLGAFTFKLAKQYIRLANVAWLTNSSSLFNTYFWNDKSVIHKLFMLVDIFFLR